MTDMAAAEAPGRVNLIGEHTDYNGGWVLPVATSHRTRVTVRLRTDERVLGRSAQAGSAESGVGDPPAGDWLDYVRGVARLLAEAGRTPGIGFEAEVASDVPQGAGLSSSAALEVATALALAAACGRPFGRDERASVARLCRRAEVEFVGVPCGIMDPWAALFAEPGTAVRLRCSDLASSAVALPEALRILVVDTGVRHALRDGGFAARQAECARALEGARAALARPLESLSDVHAADLAALQSALDPVALRRARHVVRENARVGDFVASLGVGDLASAGEALYNSHESLRVDYEVTCPESDCLVEATRGLEGAIGARMTGAGWGGCTLHLVHTDRAEAVARAVAERFEARFDRRPRYWVTQPGKGAAVLPAAGA